MNRTSATLTRPDVERSDNAQTDEPRGSDRFQPRGFHDIAIESTTRTSPFEYQPLESSQDTIRLLWVDTDLDTGPLQCSLLHASMPELRDVPVGERYRAVSYEWGSAKDYNKVLLDGREFSIRSNLFDFLCAWRSIHCGKRTSLLWIDSVSLNQDDKAEKSSQVPRMGEIFQGADEVIAWLGQGSVMVENALRNIKESHSVRPEKTYVYADGTYNKNKASQDQLAAYMLICELPYWQRLWVIQELVLASKATIQYGTTQVDWKRLGAGLAAHCSMERSHGEAEIDKAVATALEPSLSVDPFFMSDPEWHGRRSIRWGMHDKREVFKIYGHWIIRCVHRDREIYPPGHLPSYLPALHDLLLSFEESKCRYWQDKVYGLLGLVRGGADFPVDYDETAESLKQRVVAYFFDPGPLDGTKRQRREFRRNQSISTRMLNLALGRIISQGTTAPGSDEGLSSKRLREHEFQRFASGFQDSDPTKLEMAKSYIQDLSNDVTALQTRGIERRK